MLDIEKVKIVSRQLLGVSERLLSISQEDIDDLMSEMLLDEVLHAQKLVVELTKSTVSDSREERDDSVFFEGELESKKEEEKE